MSGMIIQKRMDGARGTYGEDEKCIEFWWDNPRERDQLEDLGIDEGTILREIFKK